MVSTARKGKSGHGSGTKRNGKVKIDLKKIIPITIIGVVFCIFAWTLIGQQIEISKKNKQISELNGKIEDMQDESDRLSKEVENLNNPEYIEQIAREKLGLVRPNERVFVDANKSEDNKGK